MDLPGSLRVVHAGWRPGIGLRVYPAELSSAESNRVEPEARISGNPRPERTSRTRRTCIEEGPPRLSCPSGHRPAFCTIVGRPVESQIGLGRNVGITGFVTRMDLPGSLRVIHAGGSPGTGLRAHPVVDRPFLGRRAVQCGIESGRAGSPDIRESMTRKDPPNPSHVH